MKKRSVGAIKVILRDKDSLLNKYLDLGAS